MVHKLFLPRKKGLENYLLLQDRLIDECDSNIPIGISGIKDLLWYFSISLYWLIYMAKYLESSHIVKISHVEI